MKNWIMLLILCGMIFAGTEVHETEPNDDWEHADASIFGDTLVGSHSDAESSWQDKWTVTQDQFGVVTITVNTDDGLSIAPCLWDESDYHKMLICDWIDHGTSTTDTEYLFPGTYYLDMPGSADYSAEHVVSYTVITTFQGSPSVLEEEPNNEHASADSYQLGEEMIGVWSEEDFNTGHQTSQDFFEVYLISGVYGVSAEYDPAVCFAVQLERTDGTRVMQRDEDTQPRMWYWQEGEGSKSAQYEITEEGTYFIYAESEKCQHKTTEADEFNYLLIPYTFTFSRVGDLSPEVPEPEVPETTPEPDDDIPEPTLYDDGAPPAPPECDSDSDCASGACINGYCYVEPGCPYECCTDLDCETISDICVNNECVDVFSDINCGDKTCAEGEFLNSVCECTPLGGGVIDPCCGTAFALLALFGFVIRKG